MYEKAVEMRPNKSGLVGNLADAYRWLGRTKEAMDTYNNAISLAKKELAVNPRNAATLGSLALYCAKKGEFSLAEDYIHLARSIDADKVQLIWELH
jgi:tetratricopeptide (TPR) repeat protein